MVAFAQQTFENLEMKVQIVFRHMNNLINDFKIEDYQSHPTIKAPLSN